MIGFDTLRATDTLTAAGLPEEQARAIVTMVGSVLGGQIATRTDVTELKSETGNMRAELKAEIDNLRAELKAEIAGVRAEMKSEIAGVRAEMKSEIAGVRAEIAASAATLTWRMVAVQAATVAAVAVLLRLMPAG